MMKKQSIKTLANAIVVPLFFDNYITKIKNSVGTKMYRNFYALVNGKKQDITKNGLLSCAYYASGVLRELEWIKTMHTTVGGLIKDLETSGWYKISKPKIGGILVWEAIPGQDGQMHKHIGFYIGHKEAISNNFKTGYPIKHHWTYGVKKDKPVRKIVAMYWHKALDQH